MNLSYHLKEVESVLTVRSRGNGYSKYLPEDYVGSGKSKLKFLNLRVPQIREVRKKGFSFSKEESEKLWKIWDYVWMKSEIYEALLCASHFANSRPLEEVVQNRKLLLRWVKRVDNWALSDEMSCLYAKLFEADPSAMMPFFEKWNISRNPWEARQSVVGLMFYSRFRKRYPAFSLMSRFISNLMDHDHFYVQKGVGWAIRECWNVYPEKTMKIIEKHVREIPPAGWTAATEKLPKDLKAELMKKRKSPTSSSRNS